MEKNARLAGEFAAVDAAIGRLEQDPAASVEAAVDAAGGLVLRLLRAYGEHAGKPMPVSDDLLEVFKAFVKGDPSLNAVRDNVRELVYYRNCLDLGREDALPQAPARMAVHTVRHVYLYLRSRCEQEGRLDQ